MIVKNEQDVLARCLESAKDIYDELIIVDTGSTDDTVKIARRFTRRVYNFKWIHNFAAARNAAFSRATKDYIMWLDADDIIEDTARKKILAVKNELCDQYDIVAMRYALGGEFFSTRGRLFKRSTNPTWLDEIHEYIPLGGRVSVRPDIYITHAPTRHGHGDRNIKIYESILARDGELSPRGKYYYARELKDHGRYTESVEWFTKFLDEGKGWAEDNIAACFAIAQIAGIAPLPAGEAPHADATLGVLFRAFEYDAPRPEICCMIGYQYIAQNDFARAAAWFETAINLPKRETLGFVLGDFHKFIPAIELAVCYDRIGDVARANQFNEIAGSVKPDHPSYIQNREYFAGKTV